MYSSVRIASSRDTVAVSDLAERTFRAAFETDTNSAVMDAYARDAFSPARIALELRAPDSQFFLAFDADIPLGYAKLCAGETPPCVPGPDPLELERIYVDPVAIGAGVGAALMEACVKASRERGARTLWLGVWEHNARAIAFYERWGFRTVGTKAFRLGSDDHTNQVMVKAL
ncbi:MAG: GNAT family N-acetyltransferase [Bacteroidota bacterium]